MQSQDERDVGGLAARREREAASKDFERDEVTGRYEGEELEQHRAERPIDARIGHLEKKHDELKAEIKDVRDDVKKDVKDVRDDVKKLSNDVSGLYAEVSKTAGKLDGQSGLLTEMLGIVKKTAVQAVEQSHVSFTAKVEVDKAHELAKVEVDKEQQLAAIEVNREEKVDVVKAKRDRRKRNLKLLGLVSSCLAGGGVLIELLHRIGWL